MTNKTTKQLSQLPNAPLVEVVFELHWKLLEDKATPKQLWTDPGYLFLTKRFASNVLKFGFNRVVNVGTGSMLGAHSVGHRFYKGEDNFPIWQVGPGIFASNESAAYEWKAFKKQALDGVKVLLSSYPQSQDFDLEPSKLELRYMDSFDIPSKGSMKFIDENTSLNIELPSFLKKKPIGGAPALNLVFDFPVSKKNTNFKMQIANGFLNNKTEEAVVLTSRVVSGLENIKFPKQNKSRIKYIDEWLESAHSITSNFFKDFIKDSLMEELKRDKNGPAK